MSDITICLTYFKSLTLANLAAALYSIARQDLTRVKEIIILDNDTVDAPEAIQAVIDVQRFEAPVRFVSIKHGDLTRTQAWSTNLAVRLAQTSWVLFTRADYLLDFDLVRKFLAVADARPELWDGFVVSHGCHLGNDIAECESTLWREAGPLVFRGTDFDYTEIDAGVWMARREAFLRTGGLDEALTAWGHAQTEFQFRMFASGVEFVRLREVLFYHPLHAAQRDIAVAHLQLRERGIDIKRLWERYEGAKFY